MALADESINIDIKKKIKKILATVKADAEYDNEYDDKYYEEEKFVDSRMTPNMYDALGYIDEDS